jgi:hypothetical protein
MAAAEAEREIEKLLDREVLNGLKSPFDAADRADAARTSAGSSTDSNEWTVNLDGTRLLEASAVSDAPTSRSDHVGSTDCGPSCCRFEGFAQGIGSEHLRGRDSA